MKMRTLLVITSLALSLTNCMSYDFARRVVQQGNLLPEDKINRLHTGMSKDETAILMGTSLLSPTFNNERWDYAYTWRRGNSKTTLKHVSLYFKGDRIVRIEKNI